MRKSVKEIENVLHNHGYSIDTIILNVMKTFKFKSICCKVGFQKQDGYSASEIVTLMIMLPLMLLKSVNAFYKSGFQQVSAMKKDSLYRLKNNEKMPWRALLLAVAKQFQRLVNPEKEIASHSAFILDDTTEAKTGRRIEQISMVHDHVSGKQGSKLGFKNLTFGLFDGKSFNPLDFSLHAERRLKKAGTVENNIANNGLPNPLGLNGSGNVIRTKLQMVLTCSRGPISKGSGPTMS